jgi:hypothetical protein
MKKLLAVVMAAAGLLFVGAGFASAEPAEPGPNGHNEHGLCTAYFNGQKNGHEEGDGPGALGGLEDDATDDGSNENLEDEKQVSDDVFEFCDQFGIGGNPEENGRFDCRDDETNSGDPRDSDDDGEVECIANT